jgi:AraC-like DNA-binding protein
MTLPPMPTSGGGARLETPAESLATAISSLTRENFDAEFFQKMIDFVPYPIQVFAPDGTSAMVNRALLTLGGVTAPIEREKVVGRYNILKDPAVIAGGRLPLWRRALAGEVVVFPELSQPIEAIAERYNLVDNDVEVLLQDVTAFPVTTDSGEVLYCVALLVTRAVYRFRREIAAAVAHIRDNLDKPFSVEAVASAVGLSKDHFTRVFKKSTGLTPHEYYEDRLLEALKSGLRDSNLSVAQVFASCGLAYSGYAAGFFRRRTGMTPSQWRRASQV